MNSNILVFSDFASVIGVMAAGLIATAVMTAFVLSFTYVGILSASPVDAIGSSVLGRIKGARLFGYALHATAGIVFAFIYASILYASGFIGGVWPVVGAAGIGAAHGYVVSFLIVISVGENHPWAQYRDEGIGMGVVYLVAHILYGLALGTLFSLMQIF